MAPVRRNDENTNKNDLTARVSGQIYGCDEPLRLILIQVDGGEPAERTWPARQKSFGHVCLATGRTDGDGGYQLDYTVPSASRDFIGDGQVVLQAFVGTKLRWQSPEFPWDSDLDIGGVLEPPIPPRTYSVHGQITTCGEPANGYTVSAFAVTHVGSPQPGNACLLGLPNTRFIGSSTLDPDGRYEISYRAPRPPKGACGFIASIYVEVGPAVGAPNWTSEEVKLRPIIRFDQDLVIGCVPGSTLIQVIDANDRGVAGAEVVSAATTLGITNEAGYLSVGGLADGDLVAARKLLIENETPRSQHRADSTNNWNFRSYRTTARLNHDMQGNAVSMGAHVVAAATPIQKLRLTAANCLVGFNLVVSVEWDASTQELATYRDRFREASELLYNATDGQFCIERLTVLGNARRWDSADVRVYASINQSSNASALGVRAGTGRIKMNPIDTNFPGTLVHELGHYLFGVLDEYEAGSNWDPANGDPRCTLASGDTVGMFPAEFSDGGGKHACVMSGHRFARPKKFCSAHPDNPHVDGTEQGPVDCWTVILQEYGHAGIGVASSDSWQPRGPVQRNAVIDRLPDSGPALDTVTSGTGARIPGSFIPFAPWKPRWQLSTSETNTRCPGFVVRATRNGFPVGNASIFLLTSDGRTIFQGRTRVAGAPNLQDGTPSVEGELVLRGAHVGDRVQVGSFVGVNTETIVDCAAVLEISLPFQNTFSTLRARFDEIGSLAISTVGALSPPLARLAIDGVDEPAEIHFAPRDDGFEGTIYGSLDDQVLELDTLFTGPDGDLFGARESLSVVNVSPLAETILRSADGQLKLSLAHASAPTTGRIAVRQVHQSGPELAGWQLVAGPYNVLATFGEKLSQAASLHLLPAASGCPSAAESSWLLARLDSNGAAWEAIENTTFREEPLAVSTRTSELGTYALFFKPYEAPPAE